ncbi:dynamin family protein [Fibrobacter sp.]|uniref:dynamin family protein n=1 Tax=Fibrobacter sp. TaxID=35828 RepID=UPI0025BA662E|nr:dynamin family protein [Fibrobacter sp.]MCI6436962.1 dynamin family protein [Fibrobacter sp.]MDD7498308.1 dynamin family protein [Fibrobacter sp.]MDY5724454.1 dynamin family protein [Fibrobacter sp.]
MSENIFEQVHKRKQNVLAYIQSAKDCQILSDEEYSNIKRKIDNDKLTLGVIGQMKCGKSTFLNSLIFGDDVLPAATTPMTASLSVITYGEEKSIEAEFYTKAEWDALKFESSRILEENSRDDEKSKHEAAEELVAKSKKIESEIPALLGQKKKDSFDKLIEYVGADGKYISITKSVTVYYPKDYLKGVEIVDTPGFNDPIVSREERTKDFLKNADAVLMLLYAGQPFSSTDKSIIFDTVRSCGVAKVLMGVNKYDMPYEQGEDINEVCAYVKKQVLEACKSCQGEAFAEALSEIDPMPVSANMALLSKLDMSKIQGSADLSHDLDRFYRIFEISNQKDLFIKSKFGEFQQKLIESITKNKDEILFRKPISMVEGFCAQKTEALAKNFLLVKEIEKNCSLNDDDLENKKSQLERACRRINKKLDGLGVGVEDIIDENIRRAKNEIDTSIDDTVKKLSKYVDEIIGCVTSENEVTRKFNDCIYALESRNIPRIVEKLCGEIRRTTKEELGSFVDDVFDIMQRYLPDVDSKDILKSIRIGVEKLENVKNVSDNIKIEIKGFFGSLLYGRSSLWAHKKKLKELSYEVVEKIRKIDASTYLAPLKAEKDKILNMAKKPILDELFVPMKEQLDEITSNVESKEMKLRKAQDDVKKMNEEMKLLKIKVDAIKKKKIELGL